MNSFSKRPAKKSSSPKGGKLDRIFAPKTNGAKPAKNRPPKRSALQGRPATIQPMV